MTKQHFHYSIRELITEIPMAEYGILPQYLMLVDALLLLAGKAELRSGV